MFRRTALCAALAGVAALPCARAQFTASKITFRNASGFAQADLEAAAGVHPGEKLSLDAIRAAAQRLMDSEFFSDLKVDSSGPSGSLNVIFILTPVAPEHMAKVEFDNLVWLTPEQARAAVHARIPLFEGALPEPYDHFDAAETAL